MNTTEQNKSAELQELGFSLEILSGPIGGVDNEKDKAWPHIAYRVRLYHHKKTVLETDYKLGVGHVDLKKAALYNFHPHWTSGETAFLQAWKNKPSANFIDKDLQATVAAKLARLQKVQPSLSDVLYSLLTDGEAHFQSMTFEDWACSFGYDTDSRAAEAIYRACDDIGRQIKRNVPQEALEAAQAILADY